ncbi:hypothetical protein Tco_0879704 [Tanacetum coccineum]
MFDELLTPPPSVDHPTAKVIAPIVEVVALVPVVTTGSPSSSIVDQDTPSPSNDSYFGIPILEVPSDQYLSTDSIHTIVHPDHQIFEHNSKWTKDHPLENIIGELDRPISTRLQLHEQALFCYYDAFLTAVEPKTGIFINQSKYALEYLKKFGFDSCDPVDTPIVEKSKLDEDTEGKVVDPSQYRDADHAGCQDTRRSTSGSMQFLGDKLVSWSSKRSQLTDYGLGFNKIPMYCDNKSVIALSCNNVQHSRSKHIDIKFHFIKEHVKNGVIELYFVNTEYQLADIFTKALARERIEFLINTLGMRSFTPKTLKQLANKVDEYWWYVVPTGRIVVPTGRYVVPAGKVIIIVSPGRISLVPTGRVLSPGRVK